MPPLHTLCLTPRVFGVGGMVSFAHKLAAGLAARGIAVTPDLGDPAAQAVLVIGGTRDLAGLRRAQKRGLPIVQRLDGMNWLHRRVETGLRHFLRAEYGNWNLSLIRTRFASRLVYQSHFAQSWWERVYGKAAAPAGVIYNGVDLATYTPHGPHTRSPHRTRLLLVEGSLGGGYEMGLAHAVTLANLLQEALRTPVKLAVVGKVAPALQRAYTGTARVPLVWEGLVARERIPEIDRSAHLLFSADLNAACPNAAIEALACGLPVVAFATGALPELVPPEAGRVVPYGGDPWKLAPPDLEGLARGAAEIVRAGEGLREGARLRAEAAFGLEGMVEGYVSTVKNVF